MMTDTTQNENVDTTIAEETQSQPIEATHSQSMSTVELQFCKKILRELMKNKNARQFFLEPVDPIRFNIPNYFDVIKNPMDLSTVDTKLKSNKYASIAEFASDIELMFENCFLFNHKDDPVCKFARDLQKSFHAKLKKPLTVAGKVEKKNGAQTALAEAPLPASVVDNNIGEKVTLSSEEQRRCKGAVKELKKSKYSDISWPFLLPVDADAWSATDYYTIISQPMDISTFENKLKTNQYQNEKEFESDVRLMFNNCYLYNPDVNHPVHIYGKRLENVFDIYWSKVHGLPPPAELVIDTPASTVTDATTQPADNLGKHDREETEVKQRPTKIRIKLSAPSAPPVPDASSTLEQPSASQSTPRSSSNKPRLALGMPTTLSTEKKKSSEKKPPVVLKNHDKWLALGQKTGSTAIQATSQPETTQAPVPQAAKAFDINELYEKMHQESRQREEEKRRITEQKEAQERMRLEKLRQARREEEEKQKEQVKEMKAQQERDKEMLLDQLSKTTNDINRQKVMFQRFESKMNENSDWHALFTWQRDTVDYRHMTVPGFVRRSNKSIQEIQRQLLSTQARLHREKSHSEEGEADMDVE